MEIAFHFSFSCLLPLHERAIANTIKP